MFYVVTFIQFTDLAEELCAPLGVEETFRRVSRVAAGRGCNDVANAAAVSGAAVSIIESPSHGGGADRLKK